MDRRAILLNSAATLAGMTMPWGASHAQQAAKKYRVGVLVNGGATVGGKPNAQVESLRQGMTALGYLEGTNVIYEVRYPEGQLDRLPGSVASQPWLPLTLPLGAKGVSSDSLTGRARMGVVAMRPSVTFLIARISGFWKVQHSPVASMKTVHIR